MRDYRAAEEDCSQALKVDPKSARALQFRGQVRVYQGIWFLETEQDPAPIWALAEADLTKAIELQPEFSGNWLWRGNCRFYRGFWKAAVAATRSRTSRRPRRTLWRPSRGPSKRPTSCAGEVGCEPSTRRRSPAPARMPRRSSTPRRRTSWLPSPEAVEMRGSGPGASTVASERALSKAARGESPLPDFQKARSSSRGAGAGSAADGRVEAPGIRPLAAGRRTDSRPGTGRERATDYSAACGDFLEALSINPTLKFQIGDRAEQARRKAAELQ
jgi:tetratricopeptide (TPR) repeat protein